MRIVFWNIMHGGGSRAGAIVEQILDWNPDIVSLAEFRGTAPSRSIAKELHDAGYPHQMSAVNAEEPGWNAVFLASRYEITSIQLDGAPEPELYWLVAKVKTEPEIHVCVLHAPWSIFLGRLEFYESLLKVAENWMLGPGLIIGDTNAGISGLDDETENSVEYNDTFMIPLSDFGWRDVYRVFQPAADTPTWYSPYGNGYRLDQAFANQELQPIVTSCDYDWGDSDRCGKLSDHAAILLDLELPS